MRKKKSKKGGRNKLADEKEILDEQENKEHETQKK